MRVGVMTAVTLLVVAGLAAMPAGAQLPENVTDTPGNLTTFTAKARVARATTTAMAAASSRSRTSRSTTRRWSARRYR